MIIRFLLLFVLLSLTSLAQQTTLDFTSVHHEFYGFGGTVFSFDVDPTNATNPAGRLVNTGGVWEGAYIDVPSKVLLDIDKIITLEFYSNTPSNTVLVKLEDNNNTDVEVTETVNGTGWNTVSFDFSQARISGTGTTINASGSYYKLVIFVNGGVSSSGSYFFGNITYPNYASAHSLDVIYDDLVYAEEFNYTGAVDTNEWFSEVVPPNSWGWHNGESQHYTNRLDNAYVSNGTLKIVAKSETYTAYGLTLDYTSARLNSNFNFTYGRIDVRAKLPQGDGTWPAIWMLGTSIGNHWHPSTLPWPDCGEIDIMEHWGNYPDVIHGSTHTLSSHGATINTNTIIAETVSDSFHVYSMNWSPNEISFLIDDELYYTYNPPIKNAATWPFDDPQFIILNVAMGGTFWPIDPNFVESEMEVDYVRVYQNITATSKPDKNDIQLFPNPARDFISLNTAEKGRFFIYNTLGKIVYIIDIQSYKSNIDISPLSNGLYIWRYEGDRSISSGELIILK
jgi:beta-glucanase (GH16 family)